MSEKTLLKAKKQKAVTKHIRKACASSGFFVFKSKQMKKQIFFALLVLFLSPSIAYTTEYSDNSHQVENTENTEKRFFAGQIIFEGEAGFYSREGCIGCHPDRIMRNVQPLDDRAITFAVPEESVELLNGHYIIENKDNGEFVVAKATDTGGFWRLYGRVADLTEATRDAIGCSNMCDVRVYISL